MYTMLFKSYEHLTTNYLTDAWKSLVAVLHTSVSTMLKYISIRNLIKIYLDIQELWAFSLKDVDQPIWWSAKPCHRFTYQWLDKVEINKYAKIDPNIPCGSSVMSILLTDHNRLEWCSSNPHPSKKSCYTCKWLDNVDMHMYANIDEPRTD